MSEEKIGQHYLAALHQAFPGVVLDEAWQTKDQLTITVKVKLPAGSGGVSLLPAGRLAVGAVRQR
ncbi:formate hydrogenlyase subunit 5 [Klebsiella pneumoniae]|uniref:Formate hydrogenlyase subunit 5 n=1 Tax=Klebsiella pneumoniae TaxID=573 RepID=A0A2X3HCQ4_KLEPN|nr:formate hydrogenlyase subunit 5 [Klebsiella pneumoniae]